MRSTASRARGSPFRKPAPMAGSTLPCANSCVWSFASRIASASPARRASQTPRSPTSTTAAAPPTPTATASAAPGAQSSATKTYTGDAVDTRWGPVQVQITVTAGKVTDSQAVVYPNGNGRDVEINSYALPVLSQEAVQQQSAQIDTVSGATVTSDGYVQSLQSALDQPPL